MQFLIIFHVVSVVLGKLLLSLLKLLVFFAYFICLSELVTTAKHGFSKKELKETLNTMHMIFFTAAISVMIMQGFSLPFFGGKCSLKNKGYDEYLYASTHTNDEKRRHVFTFIADKKLKEKSYFLIDSDIGGTFSIRNKLTDEYLYPNYDKSLTHPVYTWIPHEGKFNEANWKIEPLDESTFTIKNVAYNEYLSAADAKFDSSRRRVHTQGNKDSKSQWVITCDSIVTEDFDQFEATFQKVYANEAEKKYRHKIYLENLKTITDHNILYEKGSESYSLALNKFADWTHEEFLRLNGYYPSQAPEALRKAFSSHLVSKRSTIPDSKDWRKDGAVTPVRDQSNCSSCWAIAAVGALEGFYFLKKQTLNTLSVQQLVDCSTDFGNDGCNIGFIQSAFLYTSDKALLQEYLYSYVGKKEACQTSAVTGLEIVKSTLVLLDIFHLISSGGPIHEKFKQIHNEAELKDAVANIGPVAVGIDARDFKMQFLGGKEGKGIYVNKDCKSDEASINHAVLVIGYGYDEVKKMDYWLIKNSYGTSWGQDGYFKLARNKGNHCAVATSAFYPL